MPKAEATQQRSEILRAGVLLFVLGIVATTIDVVPFFFGAHDRPLWLNLACLAAPAGLIIAVVAAWRQGRADGRSAARQLSRTDVGRN